MLKVLFEGLVVIVLERTVNSYVPWLLPYAWFVILSIVTFQILNGKLLRKFAIDNLGPWNNKMYAYIIASLFGAGLFAFYWYGINKAIIFAKSDNITTESPAELSSPLVKLAPSNPQVLPAAYASPTALPFEGSTDNLRAMIGSNEILLPKSLLQKGPVSFSEPPFNAFTFKMKDNMIIVDVVVKQRNGLKEIYLLDNKLEGISPGWQYNYDADGIEVVDETLKPRLQMFYADASRSRILIRGQFLLEDLMVLIDAEGLFSSPDPAKIPPNLLKPIFEYPVWPHFGIRAK